MIRIIIGILLIYGFFTALDNPSVSTTWVYVLGVAGFGSFISGIVSIVKG